jgi:diamine N-acetyltransferase
MRILIKQNRDPVQLAVLNETVQNIHFREYPEYFKPYDYNSVLGSMKESLAKDNWHSFLALDENTPVGYLLFYIRDYKENPFRKAYKAIHIDQICVRPDYQRKNIGTLLMDAVENFARELDIAHFELTFWEKNIHAAQFYKKHEFKRVKNFVVKEI